ncbi:PAS modulated sigma54 specific transcriptional regulator, Fis family [Thermodesulfatator indicus DSM 15286]|uniref:PAS modulated sigma54 specific transcriptional regulator, Fis family n=1 Tax=Thermodesulfatator indicus (strain DSM 15286 / JCM 11887 / CIR29812) TaxID=667014 RepID=F8A8N1_THEID|nr:sigma 54-interacting transcriptional regulator [Thermodesulfatator indicus]AEH45121.1 PAS modulated sigma54 specific transcriptional regulator, Fis family [Thermodesulfatator indicus DSM 15286]
MEQSFNSEILANLLDIIQEGIIITDKEYRIVYINTTAEKLLKIKKEEALGAYCYDVLKKIIDKTICNCLKEKIQTGREIIQVPIYLQNIEETFVYISIFLPSSKEFCIISLNHGFPFTLSDTILNNFNEALLVVNRNYQIIYFNKKAEILTGFSVEEALGKSCHEILKSTICQNNCIIKESFEKKNVIKKSGIFLTKKDMSSFPAEIIASPLFIGEKLLGGLEIFKDITFEVQIQTILESIGDGVFSVDKHFKITSYNQALEKITGYTAKEALGKPCYEIFKSSLCESGCPVARVIKENKKLSNKQAYFIHKTGRKVPVSITVSPVKDSQGRLIGAVETVRDLSEISILRKELTKTYKLCDIISKSPLIDRIFKVLPDIAESESTVLITGESGTGKDIFARAIHELSPRKNGPFVAVNCAAIPDTLLESELFGYKAGAFTDAKKDKPGRFALADGGTLFLDEIGEIPLSLQAKLLRAIETKEYEPLGASKPEKADVRIIAATNQDLEILVKEGRFRQDLFYRINVVRLHLPPLRERREDIPLLIEHFIKKFRASKGKEIVGISEDALKILMSYDFPGNVRELENIIEYCFIVCKEGLIYPEHLPDYIEKKKEIIWPSEHQTLVSTPKTLEEIEKEAILQALRRNKWRKMATCRELGISKDTLRRKLKKYGLQDNGRKISP